MGPDAKTKAQKCHELFAIHSEGPDGFFTRLVTGDKSWFHYHTPEKVPYQ
jgi:hypothetical protein